MRSIVIEFGPCGWGFSPHVRLGCVSVAFHSSALLTVMQRYTAALQAAAERLGLDFPSV